jgi:hypothetical protein
MMRGVPNGAFPRASERKSMHSSFRRVMLVAVPLLAAFTLTMPAASALDERVRVRGTIIGLDGQMLNVKSREGETVGVRLADGWTVSTVVRASMADIKPGDFLGIASLPRSAAATGRSKS